MVKQESCSNRDTSAYSCKIFNNWPVSMTGGNKMSLPVLKLKYSDKLSLEQTGGTHL